jgi:hypothetical protein
MIDYTKGLYDFADSPNVPLFGQQPTIGQCALECIAEDSGKVIESSEQDSFEREMLLRQLGSCPTDYPKVIGASDFSGMLNDLRSARTMSDKAQVLMSWSDFFHGSLHDEIVALAEALESGDAEAARRSIARICA